LVISACAGCIPYHFTVRPGVSGTVLDVQTGTPITNAAIAVSPGRGDNPASEATTAADGSFFIPPQRQWGVYIVPGDVFPFPFALTVQRDGYQPIRIRFLHRAMGEGSITNFGTLTLWRVIK